MNTFNGGKKAKKICKLEEKIVRLRAKLNELRHKDAKSVVPDYELKNWEGGNTALSALLKDKKDLIVIHNMGRQCPYCTMWADGFNGQLAHLEDRAAFDEAAVRAAAEARAKIQIELEVSHAKMMSQILGLLTADQKAQLAAHHEEMKRMGPPPPPPPAERPF